MAENERFAIRRAQKVECKICKYKDNMNYCENKPCPFEESKTREEYERIVLKAIDFELNKVLNGVSNVTNIQVAKAVCDTLFGKSK